MAHLKIGNPSKGAVSAACQKQLSSLVVAACETMWSMFETFQGMYARITQNHTIG